MVVTARRIGILMAGNRSYPAYAALLDELEIEGKKRGIAFEIVAKFAEGRHELLSSLAAEIDSTKPDVVVAIGAVSYFAVRAVIGVDVPIVYAIVIDPIAAGIISPQDCRNSNVTGVTSFNSKQTSEQIRFLKETLGKVSTLAIIGDADVPPVLAKLAESTAINHGMRPVIRLLRSPDEISSAMTYFREEGATGLLGLEVPRISTHCLEITEAATDAGIATVLGWDMARAFPLLAYGTSFSDATRRAAVLAIRVAGGEHPASLPTEFATGIKLAVNLATAKRLRLEVPSSVLGASAQVTA